MKKTYLFSTVLAMLLSAAAFGQSSYEMTKKIAVKDFNTLAVRSGVTIMLTEDDKNDSVSIEGSKKYLKDVKVFQVGKTLIVSGKRYNNLKKKGVIHIPVHSLQSMNVEASAKIISYNVLQSPALNLLINGACTVDIVLNGKLNIRESEGYEFTYSRLYENR